MSDRITQYGFTFGPVEVTRRAAIKRGKDGEDRIVGIQTPYRDLDVYVSPAGRSVRVYEKGKELKP